VRPEHGFTASRRVFILLYLFHGSVYIDSLSAMGRCIGLAFSVRFGSGDDFFDLDLRQSVEGILRVFLSCRVLESLLFLNKSDLLGEKRFTSIRRLSATAWCCKEMLIQVQSEGL
jgi:hypothetical protein